MRSLAVLLFALATAAWPAAAQEPPGRVGRLALTEGAVSLYQDPDIGWERAYVNSPITSENSLWTDRGARAEMRVSATAVRLAETTQLDVSLLDDDNVDAQVARGTVAVRVRYKEQNETLAFSTPHGRLVIEGDGRYRIDVDPERDESRFTVFAGVAYMESQGGRMRVDAGRSVLLWDSAQPSYSFERAATDAFDRWTLARDEQWHDSTTRRYVSTYMTGFEDLDAYGRWEQEPEFGALWFPTRVGADWAPYRHGHWGWVRPWGWTWIDDEPWGYAPFHYGRWVHVRDRWAWTPGLRVDRPTWAPALVAWVGGSGLSVGIGAGAPLVGWYPLAPWERYEPWYRTSTRYSDRINVSTRSEPPPHWAARETGWRTWNRDRGATVVNRDALLHQRPVAGAIVQVDRDRMRNTPVASPTQVLPPRNEFLRQRAQGTPPNVPAPTVTGRAPIAGAPATAPGAAPANAIARPDFSRRGAPPAPALAPSQAGRPQQGVPQATTPAATPPAATPAPQQIGRPQSPQEQQRVREAQQQQERAAREAQQQDRAAREALQREGQQRSAREAQQQQERAAREAQQQQERAAREAQQQQERAARDAQQQAQQRDAQQRAAREAQQQQEKAAREAQQQQQRAQQQQREAQQQQEKAAREAQQNRAPRGGEREKEKEKDKDKEKDEKQK